MDADAEVQNEDWSANELPTDVREDVMQKIPQEIRRSVRKAHVGLGHPSQKTFMRMLELGGASPATLEYAKVWQCPVCAECATRETAGGVFPEPPLRFWQGRVYGFKVPQRRRKGTPCCSVHGGRRNFMALCNFTEEP